MKKLLVGGALSVALVSTAVAADMPVKAPAPVFTWTGWYVGVNAGYSVDRERNVDVTETANTATSAFGTFGSIRPHGGFVGGQIGANYQMGWMVVGVEADVQWGRIGGTSSSTFVGFLPGLNAGAGTVNRVNWFGTVRPKLGITWDRTLLYATAGFAWGNIIHSFHWADNFNFRADDERPRSRPGYVVGFGIEHAFAPNWSLKAEYQYIHLGAVHYVAPLFFSTPPVATVFAEHTNMRTELHTVRVGLNYRFDPPARAQAAGLVTKAPVAAEVAKWTGFYFGVHTGWLWTEAHTFFPGGNPALQIAGVPLSGFVNYNDNPLFGGHAGIQYQFGHLVLGIEGTLSAPVNPNVDRVVCPRQSIALFNCQAHISQIRTAGGRLGWAEGPWLAYLSGGYADAVFGAEATNRSLAPVGALILSWNGLNQGWYVGAGADVALTKVMSFGVDYRYYDFGSSRTPAMAIVGGTLAPLVNDTADFDFTAHTLALRLSYRFLPSWQ